MAEVLSRFYPRHPRFLSATLVNRLPEIERVARLVEDFAQRHGVPAAVVHDVNLSLEEVLANVMSYGYEDEAEHTIEVRVTLERDHVAVRVEDDGFAFNPLEAPPPNLAAGAQARSRGGLGLHLLRSLMDTLDYRRDGRRN